MQSSTYFTRGFLLVTRSWYHDGIQCFSRYEGADCGEEWVLLWWSGLRSVNLYPLFCWWLGLCSLPIAPSLRPNHSKGNGCNGDLLQKDLSQRAGAPRTVAFSTPDPVAGHADPRFCQRLRDPHRHVWLSLLWEPCSFLLGPGEHKALFCALQ